MMEAKEQVPVEAQRAALRIYLADPRDRVSPADMVQILSMLAKGQLLSPASTEKLMGILESTTTGTDRLKAGAPHGATVYHKTGAGATVRSEEHTSELQSLMRTSYAAFCSKK